MNDDLRYYLIRAEVRDDTTTGTARLGVIATSRDEAISRARAHVRDSLHQRRVTKVISARLSERFTVKQRKEAHA